MCEPPCISPFFINKVLLFCNALVGFTTSTLIQSALGTWVMRPQSTSFIISHPHPVNTDYLQPPIQQPRAQMWAYPQCRKIADCFYFQASKFIFELGFSSHEILEVFVGKCRYRRISLFLMSHLVT